MVTTRAMPWAFMWMPLRGGNRQEHQNSRVGLIICWPFGDAGAGVVGELDELAGDQVGWVVDEVSIHVEDLVGAVGIAQHVAGNGPQRIVRADLVDRMPLEDAAAARGGPRFGFRVRHFRCRRRRAAGRRGVRCGRGQRLAGRRCRAAAGRDRGRCGSIAARGRLRPIAGWSLRRVRPVASGRRRGRRRRFSQVGRSIQGTGAGATARSGRGRERCRSAGAWGIDKGRVEVLYRGDHDHIVDL